MGVQIMTDENTRVLFEVRVAESGGYLAVRDTEPRFALYGSSIAEVTDMADRAMQVYSRYKRSGSSSGRAGR